MSKVERRSPSTKGFILNLAAECLQADHRNPKLIEDMRTLAAEMKKDGRGQYSEEDQKRVDRQRTRFNMLPTGGEKERLKKAMLQRAYDLIWDGDTEGCDALLEFLPSDDVGKLLDTWSADIEIKSDDQRSPWYHAEHAA